MRIVGGVMDGISSRRNNWGRRGGLSGDRGGRRSRGRGRGSWLNCSRRFSRSEWIILRKNWRRSRSRFRWGGWH